MYLVLILSILNFVLIIYNIYYGKDYKKMTKLLEERVDILQKAVLECLNQLDEID